MEACVNRTEFLPVTPTVYAIYPLAHITSHNAATATIFLNTSFFSFYYSVESQKSSIQR